MKLLYKEADSSLKEFIYNECMKLVYKYENLNNIPLKVIENFEREKVENDINKYTAVYDGEEFIGCFKLTKENEYYELDDLYIVEDKRNKGYGTKILEECITHLPLVLYVFKDNKIAYDLYLRYGFEVIEDLDTRVKMKKTH